MNSMRPESQESGNGRAVVPHDCVPLQGLSARKKKAYVLAVERHYAKIYGFLYHMAGNVAVAEDLTQETFTAAWERLDRFEERASLAVWLHSIALNAYRAHLRSRRPEPEPLDEEALEAPVATPDISERLDAADLLRRAQLAVARLPDIYREAIVLRYYQGLKHREVAALLGIPIGTVQFRCHVAFEKLRADLGQEVGEDER